MRKKNTILKNAFCSRTLATFCACDLLFKFYFNCFMCLMWHAYSMYVCAAACRHNKQIIIIKMMMKLILISGSPSLWHCAVLFSVEYSKLFHVRQARSVGAGCTRPGGGVDWQVGVANNFADRLQLHVVWKWWRRRGTAAHHSRVLPSATPFCQSKYVCLDRWERRRRFCVD